MNSKEFHEQVEHLVAELSLTEDFDVQYATAEGTHVSIIIKTGRDKTFRDVIIPVIEYRMRVKFCIHTQDSWVFSF